MLASLLIGVGLFIVLGFHQWKIRRDGLFVRHIFSKSRNPGIVFVAVAIEGAGACVRHKGGLVLIMLVVYLLSAFFMSGDLLFAA